MPRPTDKVRLKNQAAEIKALKLSLRASNVATRFLQRTTKAALKRAEKAEKTLAKLKKA